MFGKFVGIKSALEGSDLEKGPKDYLLRILMVFSFSQEIHSFKLQDLTNITERLLGITFVNHHKDYGSIKKVSY